MRRRERLVAAGTILLALVAAKVGQQAYRWHAYAPERASIVRLERDLEDAGLGVVQTQVRADSLLGALEATDEQLRDARGDLDRLERAALDRRGRGSLSGYSRSLEAYNDRVGDRNQLFARWRSTLEQNREHVNRYNVVADSIRTLAERMGEPYYRIRTPAEIAVLRGWQPPGG